MKRFIAKLASYGAVLTILGMLILPSLSFAQNYAVSPAYIPTSALSTAMANQVCMSLPDSVAAQTPFCIWVGGSVSQSIADSAILTTVTSSTSVIITWNTSVPTTTTLWYADNYLNPAATVTYTNAGQGYTTSHSITITGINLQPRHLFMVGGMIQGATSTSVSSGNQWL